MRLRTALALGFIIFWTYADAQASVRLSNLYRGYTNLEVGNTARISITGASPNGTVTFTYDGGGPFTAGTTDGAGNFTLDVLMTSTEIGSHTEQWYVNDIEQAPNNPDAFYLPHAPRLPSFTVYANFTGTSCPGQSMAQSACSTGHPYHWVYSPVTYYETSSLFTSITADAVATDWNNIQNKIRFSSDVSHRYDVQIIDDNTLGMGVYAAVLIYGYDCSACANKVSIDCSAGACLNSAAVWYVYAKMNATEIGTLAGKLGITSTALGGLVLEHEMGHALRLADVQTPGYGTCSQVQGIMWQEPEDWLGCGLAIPNSCDASGINPA